MKSQITKKTFFLMLTVLLLGLVEFSNAQVYQKVEGPWHFCRCNQVGFGCQGNTKCLVTCSHSCHPVPKEILDAGYASSTGSYPEAVRQTTVGVVLFTGNGMQTKLLPLVWENIGLPGVPRHEKYTGSETTRTDIIK